MQVNKKKVLVDLSALKNFYTGLGQMAFAFGEFFKKNYTRDTCNFSLTLLVPKEMIGAFGNEVNYISSTSFFNKKFQFLLPHFDVWHAIHQLSRFKPRNRTTKYILTIHDLNYLYEAKGNRKLRKHARLKRKVKRADLIVAISNFTKKEIEQNLDLGGKKTLVIYNHVKSLQNQPGNQPERDISKPFFFTIGVIQRKKNFHVLLDLMKLYPEKTLYIAGNTKERGKTTDYSQMISERIDNENISNVVLMDKISQEEKIWMYRHCEAFLFPSLFEGFGLPIIEAMQLGKPVFSSKETSLLEMGNRFSFFWENFEANSMKELIDNNLDSFYQNENLMKEEMDYATSFTTNHHFTEYMKLYDTV